ncbi:tetratricopeptide repeat protein [Cellvibrio mixtus]|nr:hypothetical protein [Cellvibrio mixtus]
MMENREMQLPIRCVYLLVFLMLVGCSTTEPQESTLRDLDVQSSDKDVAPVFVKAKTEADIKQAYNDYLASASSAEKGRRMAMSRLAELEIAELNKLDESTVNNQIDIEQSKTYRASIQRTIDLLSTSLAEYPNAKDNDRILYQLAQNYEKLNFQEKSLDTLTQLTMRFPQSIYYAESQFRLAENAFISGDYLTAESAYSEVIFSSNGNEFYERSLVKRGWSRYKQNLFTEAIEDYVEAIKYRKFSAYHSLTGNDKSDFDEYFRALSLAVINANYVENLKNYFSEPAHSEYLYYSYKFVSLIYVAQQRYADATNTLDKFISSNPGAEKIPEAYLDQIEIFKKADLDKQFEVAMENFYPRFNVKNHYWEGKKHTQAYKMIKKSMRDNILLVADAQQQAYRTTHDSKYFTAANEWYRRYLNQYESYARTDKVYTAYAELLAIKNKNTEALTYFEKAAYDGNIVLDKEAAYATIELTDKLYKAQPENSHWLDLHLTYALRSVQLYQKEPRYQQVSLHAVELAYNNQRYADAIRFSNSIAGVTENATRNESNYIKGLSYLKTNNATEAETIFSYLLTTAKNTNDKNRFSNSLALAIYQQGKADLMNNKVDSAITHYARVAKQAGSSDIAPDSLYEAISLAVKHERWNQAVANIELFQRQFPKHKFYQDATRQLSSAYIKLGKDDRAAIVFEEISAKDSDENIKMSALWQAAALYEIKNNVPDAIRAYTRYVDTYKTPYAQYIEAMNKLSALYLKQNQTEKSSFWQQKIIASDNQALQNNKTDRTNYIAASSALALANIQKNKFDNKRLVEPLAQSLRDKKKSMQDAISLFGQASSYNIAEVTTEATYSIANIYQVFAKSLLDSERPKNLAGDELEQYNILIEDQAFPFEEKAIEFYEINMARTADGIQSPWIKKSHTELQALFPSRYGRQGKFSIFRSTVN